MLRSCREGRRQRSRHARTPNRGRRLWWARWRATKHSNLLQAGRSIWNKCSGYHRRSLVETKMHGFKRLGERVMACTVERQAVELQVRMALLKHFT